MRVFIPVLGMAYFQALRSPAYGRCGCAPYRELFSKAAALIECIINTNALINGTKRTGFLACDLFL
ncbi:MAG TPA: hypothetical protein VEG65_03155 [Candidatus Bathyarchaeia archaeon]|nr:hypothetical protein [Candidatus Bathyarchaeia archaeon]